MSTFRHSAFIALSLALLGLALVAAFATRSEGVARTLGEAVEMTGRVKHTTQEVGELASDLRQLTAQVDQQVAEVSDDLVVTLEDLQGAAASLNGAAGQLQQILGRLEQPVDDFAATGLYEFTQLIGETRVLVAVLTRITKEVERDPGSLLGYGLRGYEPE